MVFKLLGWEWELQLNDYIFAGGKNSSSFKCSLSAYVRIKELH